MAFKILVIIFLLFVAIPSTLCALDIGTPRLSEPLQQENFFNIERFAVEGYATSEKSLVEPQLAVSHDVREDEIGRGLKQTTHRVHGEAGGKLNLSGDVTLSAVAKIPVYTYEMTGSANSAEGSTSSEWLKNPGRLSWRSELGIPLGKGVELNLFYDRSTFGKLDNAGVDEREEKFGTKFIFRFE